MSQITDPCVDMAAILAAISDSIAGTGLPPPSGGLLAHRRAIMAIAAQTEQSSDMVAIAYCDELTRLCKNARIVDYLPMLTAKNVRAQLARAQPLPNRIEHAANS